MKAETAKAIVNADMSGELALRTNYSGRCMYGTETHGVTGGETEYFRAITAVVAGMVDGFDADEDSPVKLSLNIKSFMTDALQARTDSMGMGVVWY
jgi:hypothetical protein